MEKPFTIKLEDFKNKIVQDINEAKLPAFNVIYILNEIQDLVKNIDEKEIEEYNNKINKNKELEEK